MICRLLHGDALDVLKTLPENSVQVVITSPPYFGLRQYLPSGHPDSALEIGLEDTPDAYVARLVAVFAQVRRVLHPSGVIWVNIGDSYAGGGCGSRNAERWPKQSRNDHMARHAKKHTGLKYKDLIGVPWMLAFALRSDGWYLRQDIIWAKPSPMPESVIDRCTKSHEYLFMLSKSSRYCYDAAAIAEPAVSDHPSGNGYVRPEQIHKGGRGQSESWGLAATRNKRDVWTIASDPYPGAHFATFPEALVQPCILAGSRPGDTVLDPFCGSSTVGAVALAHGRNYVGIDLNPVYLELSRERLGLFAPELEVPA